MLLRVAADYHNGNNLKGLRSASQMKFIIIYHCSSY